jgi:hypothetical protein
MLESIVIPEAPAGVVGQYDNMMEDAREAFFKLELTLGRITYAAFEDPNNCILEWAKPAQTMVSNVLLDTPIRDIVDAYPNVRLAVTKSNKVWFYFGSNANKHDSEAFIAFGVCVSTYVDNHKRGLEITSYKKIGQTMQKKTDFAGASCWQKATSQAFQLERRAKHSAVDFLVSCGVPARQASTVLAEYKAKRVCSEMAPAVYFNPPKPKRQMAMKAW